MKPWSRKSLKALNWGFVIYLVASLVIRFWNYPESLYFIYDVGRDSQVLREMADGNLRLVGQTTGLPGLFYGPLWYYAGLPGFILSQGNLYGLQLWYIALSSLSIPLYWLLAHKLFGKTVWAVIAASLLSFIPGGIQGTNFVWNVMLSVPLMSAALYFLLDSRRSLRRFLLGIFFVALTLQAEFAYAVFFVVSLVALTPWLRKKWELKTLALAFMVILMTLIPQGLFELRHNFPMTKSLLRGINQTGTTVSLSHLWQTRPAQLWESTRPFFIRSGLFQELTVFTLFVFWSLAVISVIVSKKKEFSWLLITLLSFLPYVFYMFWRGNYGYFFDYYITSHFIFLCLLLVQGMRYLYTISLGKIGRYPAIGLIVLFLGLLSLNSYTHLNAVIIRPQNNAGLKKMETAVARLFEWVERDNPSQPVFRIYTRNLSTEQYDYLIWWYTGTNNLSSPLTIEGEADDVRYILAEPDEHTYQDRFLPWYTRATDGFTLTRSEQIGILQVESWTRNKE
jgi:hypothetical protein